MRQLNIYNFAIENQVWGSNSYHAVISVTSTASTRSLPSNLTTLLGPLTDWNIYSNKCY